MTAVTAFLIGFTIGMAISALGGLYAARPTRKQPGTGDQVHRSE